MRKVIMILIVLAAALAIFLYTSRQISEPSQDASRSTSLESIDRDLNVQVDDGSKDFQSIDASINQL